MKATIEFPDTFTMLSVDLEPGEAIMAETGAMVSTRGLSDNGISTGLQRGGFMGAARRLIAGESFLLNRFEATNRPANVMLSPPLPGDIDSFDLHRGNSLYIQSGSFLACTANVDVSTVQFQGLQGMFLGQGLFFLQARCEGNDEGKVFYTSYGAIKEVPIHQQEGEIVIDSGHLVAFTDGVVYKIGKMGGMRSAILGGEGFVMKMSGEGTAWIQTHNLSALADKIAPYLPNPTSSD